MEATIKKRGGRPKSFIIQRLILEFIKSCQMQGYSPSYREIGNHLGISSPSHVLYYMRMLEDVELIRRKKHTIRQIEIVNDKFESQ